MILDEEDYTLLVFNADESVLYWKENPSWIFITERKSECPVSVLLVT